MKRTWSLALTAITLTMALAGCGGRAPESAPTPAGVAAPAQSGPAPVSQPAPKGGQAQDPSTPVSSPAQPAQTAPVTQPSAPPSQPSAPAAQPAPAQPAPKPAANQGKGVAANPATFTVVDSKTYYASVKHDTFVVEQESRGYAAVGIGNNTYLVLISLGERPTGGYAVTVRSVEDVEGVTRVVVEEKAPGPGQMVTQAITHPYTIIRVENVPAQFQVVNTKGERFTTFK